MDNSNRREQLLTILLGALALPLTACGEKHEREVCLDIPADGMCLSPRKAYRKIPKQRCGYRIISIDSEGVIKVPDWERHRYPGSSAPSSSFSSSIPDSTQSGSTESSTYAFPFEEIAAMAPQQLCCYRATTRDTRWDGCVEGRPLYLASDEAPCIAPPRSGDDWCQESAEALPALDAISPERRQALAQEWLTIAQQEHASIASFAQLSLELLRYGASAELVSQCQACLQDEIRHAKIAFRFASHFAGKAIAPGPLPVPHQLQLSTSLQALALTNLQEGCCNETLASLLMLERSDKIADPTLSRITAQIARDEQGHAQFAWRLNQWFLEQEPSLWQVLDARMDDLMQAIQQAPETQDWKQRSAALARKEVLQPLWRAMRHKHSDQGAAIRT